MSQFISSLKEVKKNYKPYDAWEQSQADNNAKREYLSKNITLPKDEVELTKTKAKVVLHAAEMLDNRSENNAENMEQSVGIMSSLALVPLIFLPSILAKKAPKIATSRKFNIAYLLSVSGVGAFFTLWGNKKQKEASRIGRFQAKQHELKDARNFVNYTPEQIEAAKIIVKNMPDIKDKKGIAKAFKDMKQMSKDKKEYKKWLKERIKNPEDLDKVLNTKFSPEQLAQAQKDKEIIVNIVKDINIEAENYSENTENLFDTMALLSFIGIPAVAFGINKFLSLFKKLPAGFKKATGPAAAVLLPMTILMTGTAAQKKAARVGRYKKRKEIEENPSILIKYTDEQLKKAENIKAPEEKKGFFKGIGEDLRFLKTYSKDMKEYTKYVKKERKEQEKFNEALKQVDVSDAQLKDAKHLQEKTFMTFDKIDEMSQRYSEDTEAATEIAKQSMSLVWNLGSMGAILLLTLGFIKGKIPLHRIFKKASDIALNKQSSIRKLINQAYEIVKNDKELKRDVNKMFVNQKSMARVKNHPQLGEIVNELIFKAAKKAPEIERSTNPDKAIKTILNNHFKQGPISRWFRNLGADVSKIWLKKKVAKNKIEIPEELAQKLEFNLLGNFKNTFKNYKTLISTGIAGSIPALGLLLGVPFAFSSWMTNIQKKASKIGIMKAMEEVDNPAYFVNQESAKAKSDV